MISFLLIYSADMNDDDFKKMVLKDILITLQQKGFDIDPGNKRIGFRGWVVVAILDYIDLLKDVELYIEI